MRAQLHKLKRGISTKGERRFAEICKSLRISFKSKVILSGREYDFLIGKYVIEIDGHVQSIEKNKALIEMGYIPIHFHNIDLIKNKQLIINKLLCLELDQQN